MEVRTQYYVPDCLVISIMMDQVGVFNKVA